MEKQQPSTRVENLDENMQAPLVDSNGLAWYDPKQSPFQINGLYWLAEEKIYRRLPQNPDFEITEQVDILANFPAGAQLRFRTNAKRLVLRTELLGKADMFHMPATGQCGFDCYIGEPGEQKFVDIARFNHLERHYETVLFNREDDSVVSVTIHFPLYQGVKELSIGLTAGATVTPPIPYQDDKKLIFYGTSILQGGCANRPGMAYTNIMSRTINREFINLGFSGNGKGEANMAKLIAQIDNPACLVLDYEPNCVSTALYKETLPRFIDTYRQVHPDVPILVISKFPYSQEAVSPPVKQERLERLAFQENLIAQLQAEGDENIYFHEGTDLLGERWEEKTVDGIHPTDLGFLSMADQLTPIIEDIIAKKS